MVALLAAAAALLLAAPAKAAPHPHPRPKKVSFCGTLGELVDAADKADGFSGARGEKVAADPAGNPNAWLSTVKVSGAANCWVLAGGAIVECDWTGANEKSEYKSLDAKVHGCLKGPAWKDASIGFGANGGPKTTLSRGKTVVAVEIVKAQKGTRAHARLTVFQPIDDDAMGGLLDDDDGGE